MEDMISRKAAIEAMGKAEWAKERLRELPSAQPEERTEKRTETHACDYINRKDAIDAHYEYCNKHPDAGFPVWSLKILEDLPSAQPEIIRCGQCKYAEVADKEDAQDGYTCQFHRGSVWFSGSYCSWAERRTDGN